MIVDFGKKTTEIGVFIEESFIVNQTFDFGGDDILRDIETVLKISTELNIQL